MPLNTGSYRENEELIYNRLRQYGYSIAAVCGILANLEAESGFNPKNLQDSFEDALDYTDETYTSSVDAKTYKNFESDEAGYGLAQWTYSNRKRSLYNYAKSAMSKGSSIGKLNTQIDFIHYELIAERGIVDYTEFKNLGITLKYILDTEQGARNAAMQFCTLYEKPKALDSENEKRSNRAAEFYNYYKGGSINPSFVVNLGGTVVAKANTYVSDRTSSMILLIESYKSVGIELNKEDLELGIVQGTEVYTIEVDTGEKDNSGNPITISKYPFKNGDVLLLPPTKVSTSGEYQYQYAIIENYSPTKVITSKDGRIVREDFSLYEDAVIGIYRILSDAQSGVSSIEEGSSSSSTSTDDSPGVDPYYYTAISSIDPHAQTMINNLSKLETEGYDLGYLIDMTNGGEFRFYIPEFSESAGAQWGDIEIRGRSVDIKAYNRTSSRKISISLDLYAGEGLYKASSTLAPADTISKLHEDVYFVKSLEYPDYSNAITRPPATVHLILGSTVNIIGVISEVSVNHLKPLDSQNRAMYIKLSFTVTQTAVNPPDYKDIRAGQNAITSTTDIGSMYSEGGK